jgi:hypothetical protein
MNDFIQRIGPVDRDVDPIYRVERARDEDDGGKPPEERKKRQPRQPATDSQQPADAGPVEGDDGHLHIDIRA